MCTCAREGRCASTGMPSSLVLWLCGGSIRMNPLRPPQPPGGPSSPAPFPSPQRPALRSMR